MMSENPITTHLKPKKPNSLRFVRGVVFVIISIILVISIGSYWVYQRVYYPQKVATFLNKNIQEHNRLIGEVRTVITKVESLSNSLEQADSLEVYKKSLQEIDMYQSQIGDLSVKVQWAQNNLEEGFDEDTRKFYNLVQKNIVTMSYALTVFQDTLQYHVCLGQVLDSKLENNNELNKTTTQLSQTTNIDSFVNNAKGALERVRYNKTYATQIYSCVDGRFSSYRNENLSTKTTKSIEFYETYALKLDSLLIALQENNSGKVAELIGEINTLSKETPEIFKDQGLQQLFDIPQQEIGLISVQLEQTNSEARSVLEDIKTKYRL